MSQTKKLFAGAMDYFISKYELEASGNSKIKLNSKTFTPLQFHKRFEAEINQIAEHFGKGQFYLVVEEIKEEKKLSEAQVIEKMSGAIYKALVKKLSSAAKAKVTKVDESEMIKGAFDYSHHMPVMDISSKQRLMFNTKMKEVDHTTTFESWKDYANTRDSETRKMLLGSVLPAIVTYDPYNVVEVQYKDISGQKDVLHLNAHRTPEWRKLPVSETTALPSEFKDLMTNLFPSSGCRNYVYHWLNFALTSRNHTYLLLHSQQGIGKGLFIDVLTQLLGETNVARTGEDFLEGRFNGQIKNKRLVFLDEVEIKKDNVLKLRTITNDRIEIEEKGIQAHVCKNHASFIIANNLDKRNYVLYEDRRYSCPVMGTTPLNISKSQDWIDLLVEKTKDQSFIKAIGDWILVNGDKGDFDNTRPYKTEAFYDMVEKGMSQWKKNIIDVIESRLAEEYDLRDLVDELKNTGRATLENFLETHKDRDGDSYGYLIQKNKTRYIKVTKKYAPEVQEEENFDDEEF